MRRARYGRLLDDFCRGDVYEHPWSMTIDGGVLALWQSSFLDANPLYTSDTVAQSRGYAGRVIPPSLLLNLGLSFSVHDVSQQAIAHLAYIDVRFPRPLYIGDTFRAMSQVLDARISKSKADRGTVHVRTFGLNQHDEVVLSFERKALVRAGAMTDRPDTPVRTLTENEESRFSDLPYAPPMAMAQADGGMAVGQPFVFEDFAVGDVLAHDAGRTVGESEHMMLTTLVRNTHPLHFDAGYCQSHSFAEERVVYGGLVLSWVLAMASWDTSGNALWELGLDRGAHPAPVVAGDTLYAATKVLAVNPTSRYTGEVTFRTVGVKNTHPAELIAGGKDLFTAERDKKNKKDRVAEKVVEITRDVMLRRKVGS